MPDVQQRPVVSCGAGTEMQGVEMRMTLVAQRTSSMLSLLESGTVWLRSS